MKYFNLKTLGLLFSIVTFLMLGLSGYSKVAGSDEMVKNFTAMNLMPYMTYIGLLEILASIMLIFSKTSKWGALLISCLMSGAISIHLSAFGGVGVMMPVLMAVMAWTGHCLRFHTK